MTGPFLRVEPVCQGPGCPLTSWTPPTAVTWEMGEESFLARLERCEHRLRTWNGWVLPAFPREEVERIRAYNDARLAEGIEVDRLTWDEGGRLIATSHEGTDDAWTEAIDPVDIDGVPHWPVGSMGWTWQRAVPS